MKKSQALLSLSTALMQSMPPYTCSDINKYYDGGTFRKSKIRAKRKMQKIARRKSRK